MRALIAIAASLMLLTIAAPTASADPVPEPQCMPVYQEYDFGVVRVVRPNSCTTHVWVLGHQIL